MYELRCLGETSLRDPKGQLVHFRSRKHLALLLYLALNADKAHRRERLAHLLWNESSLPKARHSLSQALYAIRRLLDGAVRIEGADLEFEAERLRVDVLEFERLLNSGDSRAAADMWKGEFLEGFWVKGARDFEEWAEQERGRISALARDALRRVIQLARDQCDWIEVRRRCERLVIMDPFDEAAYGELMRALWMLGDRSGALNRYQELGLVLNRDLGSQPSAETEALAERIRSRSVRGGWNIDTLRESECTPFEDPPFIGRKTELESLAQAWGNVRTGESRAVALVGEGGIGKTRLAEEFIRRLALEEVTILRGRCYEAEQALPYGPIAEAIRDGRTELDFGHVKRQWIVELARLVPELHDEYRGLPTPPAIDPEGGRRRLYEAVAECFRSACDSRPVFLFIDDLQWIDESSLSLLHYAMRRVTNGLFLLVACRPEELSCGNRSRLLSSFTPVRLEPLGEAESANLLTAVIGEVETESTIREICKYSDGNPFFAIELARVMSGTEGGLSIEHLAIPSSINSLLERRFEQLSDRGRTVLQHAAFLGTQFRYEALRNAVALGDFDLDTALTEFGRSRLLVAEGEQLRFRHDLIREAVKDQIPQARRHELHRRAARALMFVNGPPAEIARHLASTEDKRAAYAYSLRGAKEAKEVFAFREAAELLELAREHAPTASKRIELTRELGRLYWHIRENDQALKLFTQLQNEIADAASTSERERLECLVDLLILRLETTKTPPKEAVEHLAELHGKLLESSCKSKILEIRVLERLLWLASRCGHMSLADVTVRRLRQLYSGSSDTGIVWRTARMLGIHESYRGNWEAARSLLETAVVTAQELDDKMALVECYVALLVLAHRTMDAGILEECLNVGLPLARQCGDPSRESMLLVTIAACSIHRRNLRLAEELLKRAEIVESAAGFLGGKATIYHNLGTLYLLKGELDLAAEHLTEALSANERIGNLSCEVESAAALGIVEFRKHNLTRARQLALHALRHSRHLGYYVDEPQLIEELVAHLRVEDGRANRALRRLEKMVASMEGSHKAAYLNTQLARLRILEEIGREEEAAKVRKAIKSCASAIQADWYISQVA